MPKEADRHLKSQLNVRVSRDALRNLAALQKHYAQRAGLIDALSQGQAVELALRDAMQATKGGITK